MSPPPTSIDGTDITGATIDGQEVQEITVDGATVFSAVNLPVAYSNLIAWYPFDSSFYGGADADDVTALIKPSQSGDSTAYNGTVNGATYQSAGGVTDINTGTNSGAFDFDGSNDVIDVPEYGVFTGNQSVTVTAWANQDQLTGDRGHIFTAQAETLFEIRNRNNRNEFRVSFVNGGDTLDGGSVPFGVWQHFAAVYDASNGSEFYIDANLEDTDPTTGDFEPFSSPNNGIGAQTDDGRFLDGRVDDVRIYNKALSASEITEIYNAAEP